jgi:hypothetical protein
VVCSVETCGGDDIEAEAGLLVATETDVGVFLYGRREL